MRSVGTPDIKHPHDPAWRANWRMRWAENLDILLQPAKPRMTQGRVLYWFHALPDGKCAEKCQKPR